MNNRHIVIYRLHRYGFDEIQVGWERVYELTPMGLMDKMTELSFIYDKATSISFPEFWKSDKEADLPVLILNNIFGIVPYYDYNGNLIFVRVVNLATNEKMEDFPGTENDLLYICKHILTYCKKVLRSWGKEPYREFRYGMEWLRDDWSKWHRKNYPDAFLRPDVRIYEIIKFNRLPLDELVSKAYKTISQTPKNPSFTNYNTSTIYKVIRGIVVDNLFKQFNENKSKDYDIEKEVLEKSFWFLFDKDLIIAAYQMLREEKTNLDYEFNTYCRHIAEAIVPAPPIDPVLTKALSSLK